MLFTMLAAFAEFERGLIIERTHGGLRRARAESHRLGRKAKEVDCERIRQLRAEGATWREVGSVTGLSKRQRVSRSTKSGGCVKILTRSRLILKALRTVQARIPSRDWNVLASFLTWIQTDTSWDCDIMTAAVNPISAALLPLYALDEPRVIGAQVRFNLPLCRLFSNRAMTSLQSQLFQQKRLTVVPGQVDLSRSMT
jgi:hypothetical protein